MRDFLHSRAGEMVRLLVELVECESPSDDAQAAARVMRILTRELVASDFRVHLVARNDGGGGQLLALPRRRTRSQPVQMLLGHCDTVWPLGTLASMPVRIEDGKLHGPGVYDMKGGLVQMLYAIDALRASDVEPPVTPFIFINCDEEIGSPASADRIRRLARRCDRVLVAEPSLGLDGRLKTARKGVTRYSVRVVGRAAHAGLNPEEGVSAVLEMSHVIQKLCALNDPDAGVTVNVGTVAGGTRANVVAQEVVAVVDVRALKLEDMHAVERAIRSIAPTLAGAQIIVEGGGASGRPPMERTPGNRELWRRAQHAATELGFTLDEAIAGGGSDGSFTSRLAPTIDGLGPVGGGAHAAHEFVFVDQLPLRAALLAMLIAGPPIVHHSNNMLVS